MNEQPRKPLGPQPWEVVRNKLDQSLPFANMRDTPYYRDAVYEQFSPAEYARRYAALRAKMRAQKLDAVVVPGGPSHWSFGGGMLWLTGHWEWHALCCYVLVPLEGDPTMIYSMGGTHAEAVRRQVEVAVKDVRHSRNGNYAQVMVERLRELRLERGRIGLMEIDPRHGDYMPVNQYNVLRDNLPGHLGVRNVLVARGQAEGRLAQIPVPQAVATCAGALAMPILFGGALLDMNALAPPQAKVVEASLVSDAGIDERIELVIRAISRDPASRPPTRKQRGKP